MADSSLVFRLFGRDISLGKALKSAGRDAETLNRHLKGVGSVGASAAKLTGTALAVSYLGASAASAAGSVVSLVSALAPAAGIVAAVPAGAVLAAGALATLKVALSGVGDAFSAALSGDAEKFQESLKDLSPAARAVATEFKELKPVLDELKNAVQDAFFKPLIGELTATAKAFSGPLKSGMSGVATELGNIGAKIGYFVRESSTVRLVSNVFATLRTEISSASGGISPLLRGLRDFASATLPAFTGAGGAISKLATSLGAFLSKAASSGQALKWVENAKAVFSQLGTIVKNIGGIVSSVFKAAQGSGGGLLGTLGQITGSLKSFFSSAQGQEALTSVFSALSAVGKAVMPVFTALGVAIGKIAPHIGKIATALGPGLSAAIAALGPALAALGPGLTAVATALSAAFASPEMKAGLLALGNGISTLFTALSPLLPVIGQVVGLIGQLAGAALTNLGSALAPIISSLSTALKPALSAISTAFEQLAPLMPPIYTAFGTLLGAVLTQLLPPILQLVPSLLGGLVPAFVKITEALIPLIPDLTDLAVLIIGQVLPAMVPLIPIVVKLGVVFAQIGVKVAEMAAAIAPKITAAVGFVRNGIANIKAAVNRISELPGQVGAWFSRVKSAISDKLSAAVAYVKGIPGKIKAALSNLGTLLYSAGQDVIRGLINGIKNMASQVVSTAKNVVSSAIKAAKDALIIKSPSKVFTWIGEMTSKGLINGLKAGESEVSQTSKKLADTVIKAFDQKKISKGYKESLLTVIENGNKKLTALAKDRESILEQIENAKKYALEIENKAISGAALSTIDFGEGKKPTAKGIASGLSAKLSNIKKFSAALKTLASKGLSKGIIQQIVEMGPDNGLAYAQALIAADVGTISQINSSQKQIETAAKSLGKYTADLFYDSGKQAGRGFLTGLQAQKKAILAAADDIAKSVVKKIKSALKIKSPSQVLHGLGAFTGQGFAGGLLSALGSVESAAGRLAGASVPSAGSGSVGPQFGAGAAAQHGNGETRIVLDVTGGDEEFTSWFRKMVRVKGRGNVQTAFGR